MLQQHSYEFDTIINDNVYYKRGVIGKKKINIHITM